LRPNLLQRPCELMCDIPSWATGCQNCL
jgi:hypothetical protein